MAVLTASNGRILFSAAASSERCAEFSNSHRPSRRPREARTSRTCLQKRLQEFPPHAALLAVLTARKSRSGLSGRAGIKLAHHFSALSPRQSENGQIDAGPSRWPALVNLSDFQLAAGHAHVPADARPVVAAVDDEVVPLRL